MKHKVSELDGALLDAAVARLEGYAAHLEPIEHWFSQMGRPSQEWKAGGPIIERERIDIIHVGGKIWGARIQSRDAYEGPDPSPRASGPTPLIAAMRAYVASKFGEEMEL